MIEQIRFEKSHAIDQIRNRFSSKRAGIASRYYKERRTKCPTRKFSLRVILSPAP